MTAPTPDDLRQRALQAEQAGDRSEALRLITQAVALAPARPELHNTAGNIALKAGGLDAAIASFRAAARLAPDALEYAINLAIALGRAHRAAEAVQVLAAHETQGRHLARYCSARAGLERDRGNLGAAQQWYDQCLALEPAHGRARHGRARVALERGDPAAPALFDAALAVTQGDAQLWLGKAQALEVAGDREQARALTTSLVTQLPGWLDGLRQMAQLRLGDGEEDFTADYRAAAAQMPDDPAILRDWAATLAGIGYAAEAAEVAAQGVRRFGPASGFALLEATHAGAAGDDERAEAIFARLEGGGIDRTLHEARHRLRRGELIAAEALLAQVIDERPDNVTGWALRDVGWRLAGDARHEWLHGQNGMVSFLPLELGAAERGAVTALLDRLHDGSTMPLGQSVRGGSQTRAGLFDRIEPELAALKAGIERTLDNYRHALPPFDADHPLLRHRDTPWRIAGSWSVRLASGGGAHISHIHPQGIVSSALYLTLPAEISDEAHRPGWLEIGRPAADLRTNLPPLREIRPVEGWLALFPSTLYHGTRPFAEGRRMTVAFDVGAAKHEQENAI